MDLEIVSRGDWGAKPPTKTLVKRRSFVNGWVAHWHGSKYNRAVVSDPQIMRSIQYDHQVTKGWGRIGYSFCVGRDGVVYEGVGWDYVGAHTQGFNSTALGVCFLAGPNDPPASDEMWEAFLALRSMGVSKGVPLFPVRSHRAVGETVCPGAGLDGRVAALLAGTETVSVGGETDPVRAFQLLMNRLRSDHEALLGFDALRVDGDFGVKSLSAVQVLVRHWEEMVGSPVVVSSPQLGGGVSVEGDWRDDVSADARLLAAALITAAGHGEGRWDAALLLAGFRP